MTFLLHQFCTAVSILVHVTALATNYPTTLSEIKANWRDYLGKVMVFVSFFAGCDYHCTSLDLLLVFIEKFDRKRVCFHRRCCRERAVQIVVYAERVCKRGQQ